LKFLVGARILRYAQNDNARLVAVKIFVRHDPGLAGGIAISSQRSVMAHRVEEEETGGPTGLQNHQLSQLSQISQQNLGVLEVARTLNLAE
jgi:hypothetical protein